MKIDWVLVTLGALLASFYIALAGGVLTLMYLGIRFLWLHT